MHRFIAEAAELFGKIEAAAAEDARQHPVDGPEDGGQQHEHHAADDGQDDVEDRVEGALHIERGKEAEEQRHDDDDAEGGHRGERHRRIAAQCVLGRAGAGQMRRGQGQRPEDEVRERRERGGIGTDALADDGGEQDDAEADREGAERALVGHRRAASDEEAHPEQREPHHGDDQHRVALHQAGVGVGDERRRVDNAVGGGVEHGAKRGLLPDADVVVHGDVHQHLQYHQRRGEPHGRVQRQREAGFRQGPYEHERRERRDHHDEKRGAADGVFGAVAGDGECLGGAAVARERGSRCNLGGQPVEGAADDGGAEGAQHGEPGDRLREHEEVHRDVSQAGGHLATACAADHEERASASSMARTTGSISVTGMGASGVSHWAADVFTTWTRWPSERSRRSVAARSGGISAATTTTVAPAGSACPGRSSSAARVEMVKGAIMASASSTRTSWSERLPAPMRMARSASGKDAVGDETDGRVLLEGPASDGSGHDDVAFEEHRVEAEPRLVHGADVQRDDDGLRPRRFVQPGLQTPHARRGVPVDTLQRVAGEVVAHADDAYGVLEDALAARAFAEGTRALDAEVGQRVGARVDDDAVRASDGLFALEDAEEVAGAEAGGAQAEEAALLGVEGEGPLDLFVRAEGGGTDEEHGAGQAGRSGVSAAQRGRFGQGFAHLDPGDGDAFAVREAQAYLDGLAHEDAALAQQALIADLLQRHPRPQPRHAAGAEDQDAEADERHRLRGEPDEQEDDGGAHPGIAEDGAHRRRLAI